MLLGGSKAPQRLPPGALHARQLQGLKGVLGILRISICGCSSQVERRDQALQPVVNFIVRLLSLSV